MMPFENSTIISAASATQFLLSPLWSVSVPSSPCRSLGRGTWLKGTTQLYKHSMYKIMNEEILSTFNGASDSSLGCLKKWDGDLASDVITKVSDIIQKSVGQAAYELSDYFQDTEVGRCVCSATKVIRFGWKNDLVPHPSFFWGWTKYTPFDAYKHDKATPLRGTFLVTILKLLTSLQEKTAVAVTFWDGHSIISTCNAMCMTLRY